MQKFIISIFILLLSTATTSFAEEKKPIKRVERYLAVLDLEAVGKVEKDVVRPLTDSVRREIVKSGRFEVMDRGNMDKVMREQALQMTGCTSKECAVEAGQLLGVGKIIVGSVSLVGKTYLLSLSLVNVESGRVEQVEDQECKCEIDDLIQLSRKVAGTLMGATISDAHAPKKGAKSELTCRQSDGRFCDHGDLTVSDKSTGLMWQQWDDGKKRTWDDAIGYCNGFTLSGKNAWRLPNKEELESIVDKTRSNPAINTAFFLDAKSSSYWSSTASAYFTSVAWNVDFDDGIMVNYLKLDNNYVRCVRGGQ